MSALAVVEEVDVERCPMGHEITVYGFDGRFTTCLVCSKERIRMRQRAVRNRRAGRHPRETLLTVPNEVLRERYEDLVERCGVPCGELALRVGWTVKGKDGFKRADIQRLKRHLGMVPSSGDSDADGNRIRYFVDRIDYDTAVVLCRALDLDPVEAGI